MAIVTSSEGLKCCLLLINLRQSISDLVLPRLSWFVGQAEVTGNKVAWPLVISYICLHSGFQKLLREMLDKICWRFSHKKNTSSSDLLWNAQYLAVLCRLALEGISSAEQTLLGPLWVRDIHKKPDAKPAIPGAQQHTVSINSLFFSTVVCAGVAKLSPWWLSSTYILSSLSITFSSRWVSREVFLFAGIYIFCNWLLYAFWSLLLSKHAPSHSFCNE